MTAPGMRTHALVLVLAWAVGAGSPAAAQTPALKGVMREKLGHAQRLLGDLATSRWLGQETDARALRQITTRPAWTVLQAPEYARQTTRFVKTLDDLIAAAGRKDLDEAATAYTAMTMACVQCHREVARMRLADGPAADQARRAGMPRPPSGAASSSPK